MSKPELFYHRQLEGAREGSAGFGMCRRVRGAHHFPPHCSLTLLCALNLMLLLSLVLPTSVSAARAGTGRISGQLLNGSVNNAPVANQSVTLQMAQGNSSRDLITLTTDAQGRYAFSALQSDSSVQYAIYTLYQGAQYVTDLIDLSKNADQQVNLTVYAATTSITNIAVVQATILVDKPNAQTGMLAVSEDFFFENLSNTTYVGSLDASKGKPDALLFSLPSNARFLSLGSGFAGYRSIQVNTGFASNVALLPGTSRLSFSFQVPYSGSAYHFAYATVYPTVTLSLLTPLNVLTTPQGLTPQGQVNAKSGVYQMFKAQTLRANMTVQANLEGLPVPVPATPTKAQAPINPAMLWLVAALILLLALAGLAGYLYNMRRQQASRAKQRSMGKRNGNMSAKSKKSAVPATKKALLQELLELDQSHEAGKIKQTTYDERRARLLARLRPLMDGAKERRAEVSSKTARSSSEGEE
ncbi:MAG TPA: carboxypeptidase-like regulatory domain-containing protein [Ktedonobacteraceae bacterium]|nr:carboxypeptidase-like regulatory domain-containing protein [Ktedonobacteraceae bacterium]